MWDDGSLKPGNVHRLRYSYTWCLPQAIAMRAPLRPYSPISYEFISVPYPTGNQILRSSPGIVCVRRVGRLELGILYT